jgi:hypothetical protein
MKEREFFMLVRGINYSIAVVAFLNLFTLAQGLASQSPPEEAPTQCPKVTPEHIKQNSSSFPENIFAGGSLEIDKLFWQIQSAMSIRQEPGGVGTRVMGGKSFVNDVTNPSLQLFVRVEGPTKGYEGATTVSTCRYVYYKKDTPAQPFAKLEITHRTPTPFLKGLLGH